MSDVLADQYGGRVVGLDPALQGGAASDQPELCAAVGALFAERVVLFQRIIRLMLLEHGGRTLGEALVAVSTILTASWLMGSTPRDWAKLALQLSPVAIVLVLFLAFNILPVIAWRRRAVHAFYDSEDIVTDLGVLAASFQNHAERITLPGLFLYPAVTGLCGVLMGVAGSELVTLVGLGLGFGWLWNQFLWMRCRGLSIAGLASIVLGVVPDVPVRREPRNLIVLWTFEVPFRVIRHALSKVGLRLSSYATYVAIQTVAFFASAATTTTGLVVLGIDALPALFVLQAAGLCLIFAEWLRFYATNNRRADLRAAGVTWTQQPRLHAHPVSRGARSSSRRTG